MKRIGITGGIGSGKTSVSKVFASLGVAVYHADDAARQVMDTDDAVRASIAAIFGPEVVLENGLDRKAIAVRVFKDTELLEQLNSIVHPAVRAGFENWCGDKKDRYVLHEAAILFETGAYQNMDMNILVTAPQEERIARVMKRDGMSREEVLNRMASQWPDERKLKLADHVIVNSERQAILPQILELHKNWSA